MPNSAVAHPPKYLLVYIRTCGFLYLSKAFTHKKGGAADWDVRSPPLQAALLINISCSARASSLQTTASMTRDEANWGP